jgi:hypothetical protein
MQVTFIMRVEIMCIFSLNLQNISPKQFRTMFYAGEVRANNWFIAPTNNTIDFTSWVDLPPSKYIVSTVPGPLVLRQGEQKNIGLQLRSTSGLLPNVTNFVTGNHEISLKFNPNGSVSHSII